MLKTYERGDEPIPGFRLVKLLGAGGCGEVWKATAPGEIDVALKIIKLAGKMGLKEFRSLQLVKRIHHPNLIPIHSFWAIDSSGAVLQAFADIEGSLLTDAKSTSRPKPNQETLAIGSRLLGSTSSARPGALVIAMGLGDNSLTDRLEECQEAGAEGIPVDELMDYMDGAAAGIDFLNSPRHDLGSGPVAIQHCDIKPRNLLIVGGAVQVCDFGLARLTDSKITSMALSAAYGAPETWRGERPRPTTDQYSLAISYYELRTGSLPFEENNQIVVMNAHLEGKLELSKLPEGERLVIARATSVSPEDRFESCRAMVAALRQAQRVATAAQPKPAVAPPSERPSDARMWRLLAFLTLLCVLVVGLVVARDAWRGGMPVPPRVHVPPPQPWLPPGFEAADNKVVSALEGPFFQRIRPQDHPQAVFILIPQTTEFSLPRDLPSFYILENKVTAGLFREFVDQAPTAIRNPEWQRVPTNEDERMPVMGVAFADAREFALWLGGKYADLPTVNQWNKAAGLYETEAHRELGIEGPYRGKWNGDDPLDIAVNRESPLPAGTAKDDVSHPFACRDMAGNGNEWTCELSHGKGIIPLDPPPSRATSIMLRGWKFRQAVPLSYAKMRDPAAYEAVFESGASYIGFRVVIDCGRAVTLDGREPASTVP
jgi:serine/threonine protein kinase